MCRLSRNLVSSTPWACNGPAHGLLYLYYYYYYYYYYYINRGVQVSAPCHTPRPHVLFHSILTGTPRVLFHSILNGTPHVLFHSILTGTPRVPFHSILNGTPHVMFHSILTGTPRVLFHSILAGTQQEAFSPNRLTFSTTILFKDSHFRPLCTVQTTILFTLPPTLYSTVQNQVLVARRNRLEGKRVVTCSVTSHP